MKKLCFININRRRGNEENRDVEPIGRPADRTVISVKNNTKVYDQRMNKTRNLCRKHAKLCLEKAKNSQKSARRCKNRAELPRQNLKNRPFFGAIMEATLKHALEVRYDAGGLANGALQRSISRG